MNRTRFSGRGHLNRERFQEQCASYCRGLAFSQERLAEVNDKGFEALSDWDRTLHQGDPDRGVGISKWLLTNQINYYKRELVDCDEPSVQITLFDATTPAPDAHLESHYEDMQSGLDDL